MEVGQINVLRTETSFDFQVCRHRLVFRFGKMLIDRQMVVRPSETHCPVKNLAVT